jgi:hypothetical protein
MKYLADNLSVNGQDAHSRQAKENVCLFALKGL